MNLKAKYKTLGALYGQKAEQHEEDAKSALLFHTANTSAPDQVKNLTTKVRSLNGQMFQLKKKNLSLTAQLSKFQPSARRVNETMNKLSDANKNVFKLYKTAKETIATQLKRITSLEESLTNSVETTKTQHLTLQQQVEELKLNYKK